jgi:hypothetical protein
MHQVIRRRIKNLYSAEHFRCLGKDSYGDAEFAEGIMHDCYKAEKITLVKNELGEDEASNTQLYFDGYMEVTFDDEFEVERRRHRVIAYSRFKGLKPNTGTTVVYL